MMRRTIKLMIIRFLRTYRQARWRGGMGERLMRRKSKNLSLKESQERTGAVSNAQL